MATSWQIIEREVVKHLNAFASGSATVVSGYYTTTPLSVMQVVDPFFNIDFIKDKCIDAQGRLANEIANVRAHPWRAWIGNSATNNILTGAVLPTTATNGKAIVGAWGQVKAGTETMTEAAPERVRDYNLHTSALYNTPYLYYIDGNRIYHTSASGCSINCCTYERADAVSAFAAGDISIPDVLVDALVAGAVAECVIEAKGMEQAGYFLGVFQKAIESIRNGQTTMPMMTLKATA